MLKTSGSMQVSPDMLPIVIEMCTESDRGCVLIGQTVVADALTRLIRAKLSKDPHAVKNAVDTLLKGSNAPLGSFWARIHFAYAAGLIDRDVYRNLEVLRKVRNPCAHAETAFSFTPAQDSSLDPHVKALFEATDFEWRRTDVEPPITDYDQSGKMTQQMRDLESTPVMVNDSGPYIISGRRMLFLLFVSYFLLEFDKMEENLRRRPWLR